MAEVEREFQSFDSATGEVVWSGQAASAEEVSRAVGAARSAFSDWMSLPLSKRIDYLHAYGDALKARRDELAEAISQETGKPRWESRGEADLMVAKIDVTIASWQERRSESQLQLDQIRGVTRYRPHGVTVTLGPFNFPGHVPNGHIVPALLAGNTVVFKPSDKTPLSGQLLVQCFIDAKLPTGVVNLVQGARETGEALVVHPDIDGLFFTGSYAAGRAINRMLADRPEVIVALEMGGNNPLVVHDAADLDAAAYMTILSAFTTSGQRCTCARRLIVVDGAPTERFLTRLIEMTSLVRAGLYTDEPEPFMGPLISKEAATQMLRSQDELLKQGAKPLVPMTCLPASPALLSPGIMDVTEIADRSDEEMFGPLLSVIRVKDFDAAIAEANNTRYGLSASLLSDDASLFKQFVAKVRAGCVNWNRQTAGASSHMPFGGAGRSGNNRPTGFHAVDYCAFPVASLEAASLTMPEKLMPGIDR